MWFFCLSASGIGREIAIVLGRLGVRVVLWDVNKMGNEETRQIIQDRGGTAYAYLVDVSNTASVMSTAEKVLLEFFSTNCTETSTGTLGNMSQEYPTPKSRTVKHGRTLPPTTHDKSRAVPPIRQITPKNKKIQKI